MSIAPSPSVTPKSTAKFDQNQIVELPLDRLDRHPQNRVINTQSEEFQSLVDSICEHGQREPGRVRKLKEGRYQLLSGERRYLALKTAGKETMRVVVVDCDDRSAIEDVAIANSSREDLDPVQRAELLDLLLKPVDKGGAGMDRISAGRVFGLTSESGVKNALRIKKLPEEILKYVRSRAIPERAARRLIPYVEAPSIMAAIVKEFAKEENAESAIAELSDTQEEIPWFIHRAIEEHSRPMDPKAKIYIKNVGHFERLFEPTESELKDLRIVELPSTDWEIKGTQSRALNVKLWEKLQLPAAKMAALQKEAKGKGIGSTKKKPDAKQLSPAEAAAEDKRKAKQADDRLQTYTLEWLGLALRCTIAKMVPCDKAIETFGFLLAHAHLKTQWAYQVQAAMAEINIKSTKENACLPAGATPISYISMVHSIWRTILWPVSSREEDKKSALSRVLAAKDTIPDDRLLPGITLASVKTLAAHVNVSVETFWRNAGAVDSAERQLLSMWLLRHTTAQIERLIKNQYSSVVKYEPGSNRAAMVDAILAAHKLSKLLPVPKLLQDLAGTKSKRKGA